MLFQSLPPCIIYVCHWKYLLKSPVYRHQNMISMKKFAFPFFTPLYSICMSLKIFIIFTSLHHAVLFLREGFVVIKVFAIHDPSLPLKVYQEQISKIRNVLTGVPNVLPFQGAYLTEKAGLLFRQYVHDTLYDRIRWVNIAIFILCSDWTTISNYLCMWWFFNSFWFKFNWSYFCYHHQEV